jgi:hypothetical protein
VVNILKEYLSPEESILKKVKSELKCSKLDRKIFKIVVIGICKL